MKNILINENVQKNQQAGIPVAMSEIAQLQLIIITHTIGLFYEQALVI